MRALEEAHMILKKMLRASILSKKIIELLSFLTFGCYLIYMLGKVT